MSGYSKAMFPPGAQLPGGGGNGELPRLPLLGQQWLLRGGSPDGGEPEPSPRAALHCWSGPPCVVLSEAVASPAAP